MACADLFARADLQSVRPLLRTDYKSARAGFGRAGNYNYFCGIK